MSSVLTVVTDEDTVSFHSCDIDSDEFEVDNSAPGSVCVSVEDTHRAAGPMEANGILSQGEQFAWNQRYEVQPTGELHVNEVLLLSLLFLPAERSTLLRAGSVCRAWRERVAAVPQWRRLPLDIPTRAPPPHVRRAVANVDSARSVAPRSWYFNELSDAYNRRRRQKKCLTASEAGERERRHRREQICRGRLFEMLTVPVILIGLAVIFLMAYGIGTSASPAFDSDAKVGAFQFFLTLIVVAVACFLVAWAAWEQRVASYAVFSVMLAALPIALVGGMLFALLTTRIHQLHEMANTPAFNANCKNPETFGVPNKAVPPYFVVFPPGSAADWTMQPHLPGQSLPDNSINYALLQPSTSTPCPAGALIAVVYLGSSINASWWAAVVNRSVGGETLTFRTTRINRYSGLPVELYPFMPWSTGTPNLWNVTAPVPAIGPTPVAAFGPEAPGSRARRYETTRLVVVIVSDAVLVLSSTSLFVWVESILKGCVVIWAIVAVLCLNAIVALVFGAACYRGTHEYCLMSHASAKGLLYCSIVLTLVSILIPVLKCCCR